MYLEQISLINSRIRIALKKGDSKTIAEASKNIQLAISQLILTEFSNIKINKNTENNDAVIRNSAFKRHPFSFFSTAVDDELVTETTKT